MSDYPIISEHPSIQQRYIELRDKGQGHALAEMLASKAAPMMGGSNRMFLEGSGAQTLTHGLDPLFADRYLERAHRAGISTQGKVYMSQLAGKLGAANPMAWVSDLDDVRTSCRLQGKGAESLGVSPVESIPEPDIPLAEDLVQECMRDEIAANPDRARKPQELREEVIAKHGAKA